MLLMAMQRKTVTVAYKHFISWQSFMRGNLSILQKMSCIQYAKEPNHLSMVGNEQSSFECDPTHFKKSIRNVLFTDIFRDNHVL